jgi:hypothetical protein
MEQLKAAFRLSGVTVPFSHNEKGMRSMSWSTDYQDVGGSVNLYGLDSYPGGLSCTNQNSGFNVVRNYNQWFSNYSYTQPNHFPEFEAGYFTPWVSTTTVLRNMNLDSQMCTTRTTLGRGRRYRVFT